jgi:hypothetical protein
MVVAAATTTAGGDAKARGATTATESAGVEVAAATTTKGGGASARGARTTGAIGAVEAAAPGAEREGADVAWVDGGTARSRERAAGGSVDERGAPGARRGDVRVAAATEVEGEIAADKRGEGRD